MSRIKTSVTDAVNIMRNRADTAQSYAEMEAKRQKRIRIQNAATVAGFVVGVASGVAATVWSIRQVSKPMDFEDENWHICHKTSHPAPQGVWVSLQYEEYSMDEILYVIYGSAGLFLILLAYGFFTHNFEVIRGASKETLKNRQPRHRTGSIISYGNSSRMQVLKIRWSDSEGYEYKLRYYNSLFGGFWVSEKNL
jgi:predicted small secreted protein